MQKEIDSFATFIKCRRIERCLSQRELGKQTGLSHSAICRHESGEAKNPNVKTLIQLAMVLNFTLDDIEKYF